MLLIYRNLTLFTLSICVSILRLVHRLAFDVSIWFCAYFNISMLAAEKSHQFVELTHRFCHEWMGSVTNNRCGFRLVTRIYSLWSLQLQHITITNNSGALIQVLSLFCCSLVWSGLLLSLICQVCVVCLAALLILSESCELIHSWLSGLTLEAYFSADPREAHITPDTIVDLILLLRAAQLYPGYDCKQVCNYCLLWTCHN
jgi:hypothetical protein